MTEAARYGSAGCWAGGDGCHREVVFAPLDYDSDGSLVPVRPQVGSYVRSLITIQRAALLHISRVAGDADSVAQYVKRE
ncbi:hypothetical protein FKX98_02325 [Bifidobacterium breve]|uniref:hypothetical protein n=1 Tax=Bifidobacterium breve TaxID=1685 RepID=UPI001745EB8B|nr:hypothetical protein [Bifidobacterium breve]MBD3901409.1 hypothetical protein [Bifidobacterium breve]